MRGEARCGFSQKRRDNPSLLPTLLLLLASDACVTDGRTDGRRQVLTYANLVFLVHQSPSQLPDSVPRKPLLLSPARPRISSVCPPWGHSLAHSIWSFAVNDTIVQIGQQWTLTAWKISKITFNEVISRVATIATGTHSIRQTDIQKLRLCTLVQ